MKHVRRKRLGRNAVNCGVGASKAVMQLEHSNNVSVKASPDRAPLQAD